MIAVMVVGIALIILHRLISLRHSRATERQFKELEDAFSDQPCRSVEDPPQLQPGAPTVAFIVPSGLAHGLRALRWVQRMFPNHFRNFVLVHACKMDAQRCGGEESLSLLKQQATVSMNSFVNFCNGRGLAARCYIAFGTDSVHELVTLSRQVARDFPGTVFFAAELIFEDDTFFNRLLRSQAPHVLQRRLSLEGMQMATMPMTAVDKTRDPP